jgi:uncharacterized membrane protein
MKSFSGALKLGTRQITVVGMLSAISIVMGLTGLGFIPFPTIKATIMHLPVIAGAIIEGPVVGAFVGLIFGLFSVYQNMMAPSVLSFALLNPLVSVLPRILIGITSYYAFKLVRSKSLFLKVGVGAFVGSFTNTLGVMGMILALYGTKYAELKNIDPATVTKFIFASVILPYGTVEALVAVAVIVPLVLAIKKMRTR